MITCPNCAWRNPAGSKFCENCGADLEVLSRTAGPVSAWPQPPPQNGVGTSAEDDPSSPDWRMAPLPVEEAPQPKRRIWVWFLVIALLVCLTFCAVSFGWLGYTDSGQNFQTRVAEEERIKNGD